MDPRSTPGGVLGGHANDEPTNPSIDSRPSRASGHQLPVAPGQLPVPCHHSLRLDEHQGIGPAPPSPSQRDPEASIGRLESRTTSRPHECLELLAQRDVLEDQVGAAPMRGL